MNNGTETKIAVMSEKVDQLTDDVREIKNDLKELKTDLPKYYVSKSKFETIEKVFWIAITLLITTVGGWLLGLIGGR